MARLPGGRKEIAFVVAVLLGLGVGLLIKKAKVGLLIGLVLGILIVALRPGRKQ